MNVDDLNWQVTTYGGISPQMTELLLERGRLDLVIRAASERGEWFCAEAAVRVLCETRQFERAWAVMEPFVAIGWAGATRACAEILVQWGHVAEALALVRPGDSAQTSGAFSRDVAELLVKAGRVDEVIDAVADMEQGQPLSFLVEITEGQRRDDRVLALIAPRAEQARRAIEENSRIKSVGGIQELQAQVLERAGQADEAIRLLGEDVAAHRYVGLDTVDFYAQLLVRHGRIDELKVLRAREHDVSIAGYYARALENTGRVQEAEEVLRESLHTVDLPHHRAALVGFLSRQGRFDEAVEIGRPTFERFDDGNLLEGTLDLLAENGRPEQALEVLDALSTEFVKESVDVVHPRRLQLLGAAGRLEEAITEAVERYPDGYYTDEVLAELLQQDGRVDEAVDVLNRAIRRGRLWAPRALFELLMRQDRPDDAVAALPPISDLRKMRRGNVDLSTNGGYGDCPPH